MESRYIDKQTNDNARYLKALKRVKQIQGFYWHLFLYLATVIAVAVVIYGGFEEKGGIFQLINYIHVDYIYWNVYWFWMPFAIWGIVVLIQGIYLFGFRSDWEERKIRELMAKDEKVTFKD